MGAITTTDLTELQYTPSHASVVVQVPQADRWVLFIFNSFWLKSNIIFIKVCHQHHDFFWLSLIICPYWSSLLSCSIDGIQCLYIADEYCFLLIVYLWCVHVLESIGEHSLLVCSYFTSSVQSYFVHLTWMVYEMRGKWPYSCCFVEKGMQLPCVVPILFFLLEFH